MLSPVAFTHELPRHGHLHVFRHKGRRWLVALGSEASLPPVSRAGPSGLWTPGWEPQSRSGDFTLTRCVSERAGRTEALQGAAKGVHAIQRPRAKSTRWQRNEGTAGDKNHTGDMRDKAKNGA